MKGELKAGGLALVLGNNPHTGKCVHLVQLVYPRQLFKNPLNGDVEAMHFSVTSPGWLVTGDIWTRGRKEQGWALFNPALLMPIDGDDDPQREQLTKDKPVELTAYKESCSL